MNTSYSELDDYLSCQELKKHFSEFLSLYSNDEDVEHALDELFELADRQWYTYEVLDTDLRGEVDSFVSKSIDIRSYNIMESIMTIIPRLGLVNSYDAVIRTIKHIDDKRILKLVTESIEQYGKTVSDPYAGMK